MSEPRIHCPDCDSGLDRRDFLRIAGVAAAGGLPLWATPRADAAPTPSSAAETAVKALFDSLTVSQNIKYPLREHRWGTEAQMDERVAEVLDMVGLPGTEALKPAALSGGMRKRVGLARAIAMKPEVILYDEPTTGLDPITATTITDLIVKVRDLDGVTSILVTHQLRDAFNVARTFMMRRNGDFVPSVVDDMSVLEGTEFLMLKEGEVEFEGSAHQLQESADPYIREFLS